MKAIKTAIKSTLLIDPEEKNNTNLITVFNEFGLELDIISAEQNFISKIENKTYDCVMINSDLPDNQTNTIIDALKINYPWMIVIILLVNPNYEKIFGFVRLGVNDFLMKPLLWEEIEKLLRFYYF